MRKKKLALLVMIPLLLLLLNSCDQEEDVQIAFIIQAPLSSVDLLESAWEGVDRYSQESGRTCKWYEPEFQTAEAQLKALENALADGAELVIFPSYMTKDAAMQAQRLYPDTGFIFLDIVPDSLPLAPNACALVFDEQAAGFLAGYSAVMDGFTELGFLGGMAQPPIIHFGYGYVYGAEYAAQILGLEPGSIEIRYTYSGTFSPRPECQIKASRWYWEGTQLIFACAENAGSSVIQAAKSYPDTWVIGADYDQSDLSDQVLTSAVKHVPDSVYAAVKSYFEEEFPGGSTLVLGAQDHAVGLSMETSRFQNFSIEDYEEIYQAVLDNAIPDIPGYTTELQDIPLTYVELTFETMR